MNEFNLKFRDKNLINWYRFYSLIISTIFISFVSANHWELYSPNHKLMLSVELNDSIYQKRNLNYRVIKILNDSNSAIIESSPLGIIRSDQDFSSNLTFINVSKCRKIDDNYTMKLGRQSHFYNKANEITLTFKNPSGALFQLILRVYNNGAAFRYAFPEKSTSNLKVIDELTGFKFQQGAKMWLQPYDKPTQYSPAYENFYENAIPVGNSSPNKEGWAFPVLVNTGNNWVLVSESNLKPDYCGIHLNQSAENGFYRVRFPEIAEAQGFGDIYPQISLPWRSPWRFITVTSTAQELIETHLVNDLADSPDKAVDYSWVKPGRASWSWLSDNSSTKDFEKLKEYVDFTSEMKWEYSLVDANWDLMKGGTIEDLVKYANQKGVGILMWYNSGGPNNSVTERPRDIIFDPYKRQAEFIKLNQWGVKGIKVDFWGSDKQILIRLYHEVLCDAAKYHIMVNFHGCTIPRGWSKTFPNLISLEAVKGEENYLFSPNYPQNAPVQNSILAFTRNVIGPMDYTPVGLSNFNYPHITSMTHELALSIIFNCGITHFADNCNVYRNQPDFVLSFLKSVPTVFDESHCVFGEPGKDIVIAARKKFDWYLVGINSEGKSKSFTINLPFLKNDKYKLDEITDSFDNKTFKYHSERFLILKKINISMNSFGGFIYHLRTE